MLVMDLDETFRPVDKQNIHHSGITAFESQLVQLKKSYNVLFGIITGSNLVSVNAKLADYTKLRPGFVSTSLGTEFYWFNKSCYVPEPRWIEHVGNVEVFNQCISNLEIKLGSLSKKLILQPEIYQGERIRGYYLAASNTLQQDIQAIINIAEQLSLKADITECSVAAGDPSDHYDVAIMPLLCGKANALNFAIGLSGVVSENVFVFGDGCNDIEMLSQVRHGYLVENAHDIVKAQFPQIAKGKFSWAAVNMMKQMNVLLKK